MSARANADRRSARIAGALVFGITLAVYAAMLPARVGIGDEAEAQTVPYILGVAHPTGFPAYTLAGWLWAHVVAVNTVAWRLNAFVALLTAASAAGVCFLALALGSDLVAATLAALTFGFGGVIWNGALHANAQVLASACCLFSLLACVWYARSGNARTLAAAALLCGLGMAAHPIALFMTPALATAMLWQRAALDLRRIATAAVLLVLPLALYAYPLVRAATLPGGEPNAGAPTYGLGNIDWNLRSAHSVSGMLDESLGRNEQAQFSLLHAIDVRAMPAAIAFWFRLAAGQYALGMLLLAAAGAALLAGTDRRALSVLVAGTAGSVAFARVYRNDLHIDRYVFLSFAAAAALAAVAGRIRLPRIPATWVRGAVVLALAALTVQAAAANAPLRPAPSLATGDDIIAAVRRDTQNDAVVVAQWNDAAALGYGAYIDHALGDRIIVAGWPVELSSHYNAWARSRPVIVYVSPIAIRGIGISAARVREVRATLPQYHAYEVVSPRNTRR